MAHVPSRDLDELLHVHVHYELDMLFATFEQLQTPVPNVVVGNALFESFCMHARALIDFFDNTQGLQAREFTDTAYRPLPKDQLGISDTLTEKLNTQIADLTKRRADAAALKIGVNERQQLKAGLLLRRTSLSESVISLPSHSDRWKT